MTNTLLGVEGLAFDHLSKALDDHPLNIDEKVIFASSSRWLLLDRVSYL